MSGKGVRGHLQKRKPATRSSRKDWEPGSRPLVEVKKFKSTDDTKRVWLEVWEDGEMTASGDLQYGWSEALFMLEDNPELEILEKNYDNKDLKYFYTWLVQAPEGKQLWVCHFTRKTTDICCYTDHKGLSSINA